MFVLEVLTVFVSLCMLGVLYFVFRRKFISGAMCPSVLLKKINGKKFLVTGGTDGIGKSFVQSLVRNGANKVVIGYRNEKKKQKLLSQLKKYHKKLQFLKVDLSSLEQVRSFSEMVEGEFPFDVVVLNAGIITQKRCTSKEGVEIHFAVNYLANFYLLKLLSNAITKNKTRVITVGSDTTLFSNQDKLNTKLSDIFSKREELIGRTDSMKVLYGQSKLFCVFLARGLNQRLTKRGSKSIVVSVNPGNIISQIWNESLKFPIIKQIVGIITPIVTAFALKTKYEGMQTYLFCSTAGELVGGEFYECCAITKKKRKNKNFYDDNIMDMAWNFSEKVLEIALKKKV